MDVAASERNKAPMQNADDPNMSTVRSVSNRTKSGLLHANSNHEFVFHVDDYTRKHRQHLLRPKQLALMCPEYPHCKICPMHEHDNVKWPARTLQIFYAKIEDWANRLWSFLIPFIPGVINPHAKVVQQWNKFFIISCSFAVFLDPFLFFLLYVQENNKCIKLNWHVATTLIVLKSMNDFIYLLHILLQFRLAYVDPKSRVVGSGDLVDDPKKIVQNYLYGHFIVDFFVLLPLSQIVILLILWDTTGSGFNHAKNLLRLAVLVQLIPRLRRILPLVVGPSPTGFIFESAWSNVAMNLLTFVLASHVVGSCWYLFSLQRVNQCFQDACRDSNITRCTEFINCGHVNENNGDVSARWEAWKNNENAIACFGKDGFDFGIYQTAVNLTTQKSIVTRYVYSLSWGFQQISTLAGNQVPSYFLWEVVFTMTITGVGLLLFALLIGNVQNFLQALGRRRVEMSVRLQDVELWMSHHRLPDKLRSQVRNSERLNWATTPTSVVNEKNLMDNLPEDLQRQIRRHLFKFVEKVRMFQLLDEHIIDVIRERLKTKTYIQGSKIWYRDGLVDKMVFIIRGKIASVGEDGISYLLSEGDVCGEELLPWCLQHFSVDKDGERIRIPGHRLLSNRIVSCLTNVEVFVLRAADLEEVMSLFTRFLTSPRIQHAIRYESPFWRELAAKRIQVAWRCKNNPICLTDSLSNGDIDENI